MALRQPIPKWKPITFTPPTTTPDVCLRVFYQDFHVHSSILKQHSAFFQIFLDPPDKKLSGTSADPKFKYDWRSKIDEDGTWALVCADKINPNEKPHRLLSDDWAEVLAFDSLLRTFYGERFRVKTVAGLQHIVRLADYYRALPRLSECLSIWLKEGDGSVIGGWGKVTGNCVDLLEMAFELRCSVLFKDCLLLCIGGLRTQRYGEILNDRLRTYAERECSKMRTQFFNTMTAMWEAPPFDKDGLWEIAVTLKPNSQEEAWEDIVHQASQLDPRNKFQEKLKAIAQNRLAVIPYVNHRKYLLFAEINDHDLPWDIDEKEW